MTIFIIAFIIIMVIWIVTRGLSSSPQGRRGRRDYDGRVWPDQSTSTHVFPPHMDVHQQHHHNSNMGFGHTDNTSYVDNSAGGYTADSNVNADVSSGSWDSGGSSGSNDFGGFGGGGDFGGGGSGGDFGGGGGGDFGGGGGDSGGGGGSDS